MVWLKRTSASILTSEEEHMDENEKEWRAEVISRCMEEKGDPPTRAMVRTAEGSPYSWTGSTFAKSASSRHWDDKLWSNPYEGSHHEVELG